MARLDAKWYWGRGQTWYHFWQDTIGGSTNHELSIDDSVSLSEEKIKSVVLLNEDSVTVSDSKNNSVSIFENDNVLISDEIQLLNINHELSISDSVTINDNFSYRKVGQSVNSGGYIRRSFTEPVNNKKEQAKKEDEFLLMVINRLVEKL